ncbi:hypothetical protein FA13DRAFT_1736254, partial [Coprinellus micaceus]
MKRVAGRLLKHTFLSICLRGKKLAGFQDVGDPLFCRKVFPARSSFGGEIVKKPHSALSKKGPCRCSRTPSCSPGPQRWPWDPVRRKRRTKQSGIFASLPKPSTTEAPMSDIPLLL